MSSSSPGPAARAGPVSCPGPAAHAGVLPWVNWLRELLDLLGIARQEEEPSVWRLTLRDEEARLFGLRHAQTLLWVLDPDRLSAYPQAELVMPGSERFRRLLDLARRRSRLARLFLPPPVPDPHVPGPHAGGAGPPAGGDTGAGDLRLCPVAVFFFQVERTRPSPVQSSDLLLDVAVDLLSGETRPWAWSTSWKELPWQEEAPPWPPRERRRLGFRAAFQQAAAAARDLLATTLLRGDVSRFEHETRKRQAEEELIHAYFDSLAREERALRREEERRHHLLEVDRRHPLVLDGRLVSLLLLWRPLVVKGETFPPGVAAAVRRRG